MKIRLLKSAIADLVAGYRFYHQQEEYLGEYFLDTLTADIDSLQLFAGIHSIHFNKYFRMLSSRFPFAVYYKINDNVVVVYAVLDCRANPRKAKTRLQ